MSETEQFFIWTTPFQIIGLLCFLIAKRKNLALGFLLALLAPELFFLVAAVIASNRVLDRVLDGYDGGGFIHLELLVVIIIGLIANSICSLMTAACLFLFYKILSHRRGCSVWDFLNKPESRAKN
jgi:hypothetical protein